MRAGWSRRCGALWTILILAGTSPAPLAATTANSLCDSIDDPCVVDEDVAVDDGSVVDLGGRTLLVTSDGSLDAGEGTMTLVVGRLSVEAGGMIRARGTTSTLGGLINVNADSISIAGTVDTSGAPGGEISMTASGAAEISGEVVSDSRARSESGGTINLSAGTLDLTGELSARGGTESSLGGDVDAVARGDVFLSGVIDVTGPDGGTVNLEAGSGAGVGNLTLTDLSIVDADGKFAGGFGGIIDLSADGDGLTTGLIRIDGRVTIEGDDATEDVGGGSGGCLTISASGDIISENPDARLSVRGGGPDGDGGEIEIITDLGAVQLAAVIDVSAGGTESGGGAASVDAFMDVSLTGDIDAFAGSGGEITATSLRGGVTLGEDATIDVSGRQEGDAGAVCLESAGRSFGASALVLVAGDIIGIGGGGADGGAVELLGLDLVRVIGRVDVDGGAGGLGGSIVVTASAGPALIEGDLTARGSAREGGSVAVDGQRIAVSGLIDVGGGGRIVDTEIGLRAFGAIDITGELLATGGAGGGGLVEVWSDGGDVTVAGTISSDGNMEPGGLVDIRACNILVCGPGATGCPANAVGVVRSEGPAGTNRLTGRESIAVVGTMAADRTGRNEVIYRTGGLPPVLIGDIDPVAAEVESSELLRCALTPFVLAREIFDGDRDDEGNLSDSVDFVARGAFAGNPGADANDDGRITAADFVAL